MKIKKSIGDKIFDVINYTFLTIIALSMVYPFYYILVLSFNDGLDSALGGVYLWPRVFTVANYMRAFQNPNIISAYAITLFRTIIGTALSVLLISMMAYALTKKTLPGRTGFIFMFFFTTLFNGGMIPFYILLRKVGLTNNIWVYIIPSLYNFFNMVIIRTYFETIPKEISEAAEIDGCTDVGIFFRLYLRLSGPVIATIVLFTAVGHWNDWFTGTFYVTNRKIIPAATLLQYILKEADMSKAMEKATEVGAVLNVQMDPSKVVTPEALKMAFVMIMTIPIVCVYPFLQKYFVKGVMIGSIKG